MNLTFAEFDTLLDKKELKFKKFLLKVGKKCFPNIVEDIILNEDLWSINEEDYSWNLIKKKFGLPYNSESGDESDEPDKINASAKAYLRYYHKSQGSEYKERKLHDSDKIKKQKRKIRHKIYKSGASYFAFRLHNLLVDKDIYNTIKKVEYKDLINNKIPEEICYLLTVHGCLLEDCDSKCEFPKIKRCSDYCCYCCCRKCYISQLHGFKSPNKIYSTFWKIFNEEITFREDMYCVNNIFSKINDIGLIDLSELGDTIDGINVRNKYYNDDYHYRHWKDIMMEYTVEDILEESKKGRMNMHTDNFYKMNDMIVKYMYKIVNSK